MDKDNWFAGRTLHYEAIGVLMCPWHIVCGIDPDLCYVCYVRGCYLVPSIGGAPTQGGARRTQHETDASIYKWKPTHSDAIRVRRPTFAKTDLTQKRRKYLETKLSRSQTCLEIDLPRNPHLPKPIYIYVLTLWPSRPGFLLRTAPRRAAEPCLPRRFPSSFKLFKRVWSGVKQPCFVPGKRRKKDTLRCGVETFIETHTCKLPLTRRL